MHGTHHSPPGLGETRTRTGEKAFAKKLLEPTLASLPMVDNTTSLYQQQLETRSHQSLLSSMRESTPIGPRTLLHSPMVLLFTIGILATQEVI